MGKTILTPKQLNFLELAQAQTSIVRNFYLTGGTALSEFYFKHRLSEDIDLFSEKEVKPTPVRAFLEGISEKLGICRVTEENYLGLYTYKLLFRDGKSLKVDFSYYPFPQIEKGTKFGNLEVSSMYDIAVNKLHTISQRFQNRDYVDLYFIFNKTEYSPQKYLERMRLDSQAKFDWPLEAKNLAAAFLKVKDIKRSELPHMLVPFDNKAMEEFFIKLAKSLEKDIFK